MKKAMLRMKDRTRRCYADDMPNSLEYGVWYEFVTPFHWQYFKIEKSSRYVHVYDIVGDKKPKHTFSKKRFLADIIWWAKSPICPVNFEDAYVLNS